MSWSRKIWLIIVLLALIPGISNGQKEEPTSRIQNPDSSTITHFGEWFIGKTTTAKIRELASKEGIIIDIESQIKPEQKYKLTENATNHIVSIIDGSDIGQMHVKGVGVYFINFLEISGVKMGDISFHFYNDTLYQISIKSLTSNVSKALDSKYGLGKVTKVNEKIITCKNSYNTSYEKEEGFYKTWGNSTDEIRASHILSTYFDDKCEKRFVEYLTLQDHVVYEMISKEEEKVDKSKELNKLSGF